MQQDETFATAIAENEQQRTHEPVALSWQHTLQQFPVGPVELNSVTKMGLRKTRERKW